MVKKKSKITRRRSAKRQMKLRTKSFRKKFKIKKPPYDKKKNPPNPKGRIPRDDAPIDRKHLCKIIQNCGGLVTHVAKKVGVSHTTIHSWRVKYPWVQEAFDAEDEAFLDLSETQLKKNVKRGSEISVFFHLKCKGKQRGYIEKQIIKHEYNPYEDMDDDELDRTIEQHQSSLSELARRKTKKTL